MPRPHMSILHTNTAPDNTLPHSIPQITTLPDNTPQTTYNTASDNTPDNTAPHSPTHLIAVIYHARRSTYIKWR